MFIYGLYVFLMVYAYTELMDKHSSAIVWETIKNILGLGILYFYGDWFGASRYSSLVTPLLLLYFVVSTGIVGWFVYRNRSAGPVIV